MFDSVAPLLDAWKLEIHWAEGALGASLDVDILSEQHQALISGLLECAALLDNGSSLALLVAIESSTLRAVPQPGDGGAVSEGVSHEPAESETSGLRDSGMERLRRPADQGVQPTNRTLATALQTLAKAYLALHNQTTELRSACSPASTQSAANACATDSLPSSPNSAT